MTAILEIFRSFWQRHAADLTGLMIAGTAIPLVAKWVPINRWYGFRTPLSMASPEAWFHSNQVMGLYMVCGQIIALLSKPWVVAWLSGRWPWDKTAYAILWVCAVALGSIGAAVLHVYARP